MKNFDKGSVFFICLLLLISLIFLRFFFKLGVPYTHDGNSHLARIGNLLISLRDFHLPPRWAPHLNYKFGYPVFNFNYYLPFLLVVPWKLAGFSIETSWKLVVFLSFWGGGVGFYFLARRFFNSWASFLGAVFYLLNPYQLANIFVRGATGETAAFGFLPWTLLAFYLLSQKKTKSWFLISVLLTACLALVHNIITMISFPFLLGFILLLGRQTKEKKGFFYRPLLWAWLMGILLSLYFWLPALLEKKYVTLDLVDMSHFYRDHFPTFRQLVANDWGYGFSVAGPDDGMSFSLGPFHFLLVFLTSLFFLLKKKWLEAKPVFISFFFLSYWLAFFLMLEVSGSIWQGLPLVSYVQFPWRLLFLTTFNGALIISFSMNLFKEKKLKIGLGLGLILIVSFLNLPKAKPQSLFHYPDYVYYEFPFTSSIKDENMPIWFDKEKNYQLEEKLTSQPEGGVSFEVEKWQTGRHFYQAMVKEAVQVFEKTAYFPGWKVYIDDQAKEIDYRQEKYPGLISYELTPGKHRIKTVFTEDTWPRKIGDGLSLLTLGGLLVILFWPKAVFDDQKN